MEFLGRIKHGGGLDFGERNGVIFKRYLAEHPGMVLKITPVLPESGKQRGFLEGGVLPLIAYYQEGLDHRNAEDVRKVRDWMHEEFSSEWVELAGKAHLVPKSTKGRDNLQRFLESVLGWLVENYAPPQEALSPEKFKHWREAVFPFGGPDNYIDYLVSLNIL
jgi:hypothetical protein